ncbi:hypothetical protein DFJ77DRAFT_174137 [Powellomyces hirtus]|nr:hypothetical protein DFJ77DRAFT_174137 [Powellomyces hirtus]
MPSLDTPRTPIRPYVAKLCASPGESMYAVSPRENLGEVTDFALRVALQRLPPSTQTLSTLPTQLFTVLCANPATTKVSELQEYLTGLNGPSLKSVAQIYAGHPRADYPLEYRKPLLELNNVNDTEVLRVVVYTKDYFVVPHNLTLNEAFDSGELIYVAKVAQTESLARPATLSASFLRELTIPRQKFDTMLTKLQPLLDTLSSVVKRKREDIDSEKPEILALVEPDGITKKRRKRGQRKDRPSDLPQSSPDGMSSHEEEVMNGSTVDQVPVVPSHEFSQAEVGASIEATVQSTSPPSNPGVYAVSSLDQLQDTEADVQPPPLRRKRNTRGKRTKRKEMEENVDDEPCTAPKMDALLHDDQLVPQRSGSTNMEIAPSVAPDNAEPRLPFLSELKVILEQELDYSEQNVVSSRKRTTRGKRTGRKENATGEPSDVDHEPSITLVENVSGPVENATVLEDTPFEKEPVAPQDAGHHSEPNVFATTEQPDEDTEPLPSVGQESTETVPTPGKRKTRGKRTHRKRAGDEVLPTSGQSADELEATHEKPPPNTAEEHSHQESTPTFLETETSQMEVDGEEVADLEIPHDSESDVPLSDDEPPVSVSSKVPGPVAHDLSPDEKPGLSKPKRKAADKNTPPKLKTSKAEKGNTAVEEGCASAAFAPVPSNNDAPAILAGKRRTRGKRTSREKKTEEATTEIQHVNETPVLFTEKRKLSMMDGGDQSSDDEAPVAVSSKMIPDPKTAIKYNLISSSENMSSPDKKPKVQDEPLKKKQRTRGKIVEREIARQTDKPLSEPDAKISMPPPSASAPAVESHVISAPAPTPENRKARRARLQAKTRGAQISSASTPSSDKPFPPEPTTVLPSIQNSPVEGEPLSSPHKETSADSKHSTQTIANVCETPTSALKNRRARRERLRRLSQLASQPKLSSALLADNVSEKPALVSQETPPTGTEATSGEKQLSHPGALLAEPVAPNLTEPLVVALPSVPENRKVRRERLRRASAFGSQSTTDSTLPAQDAGPQHGTPTSKSLPITPVVKNVAPSYDAPPSNLPAIAAGVKPPAFDAKERGTHGLQAAPCTPTNRKVRREVLRQSSQSAYKPTSDLPVPVDDATYHHEAPTSDSVTSTPATNNNTPSDIGPTSTTPATTTSAGITSLNDPEKGTLVLDPPASTPANRKPRRKRLRQASDYLALLISTATSPKKAGTEVSKSTTVKEKLPATPGIAVPDDPKIENERTSSGVPIVDLEYSEGTRHGSLQGSQLAAQLTSPPDSSSGEMKDHHDIMSKSVSQTTNSASHQPVMDHTPSLATQKRRTRGARRNRNETIQRSLQSASSASSDHASQSQSQSTLSQILDSSPYFHVEQLNNYIDTLALPDSLDLYNEVVDITPAAANRIAREEHDLENHLHGILDAPTTPSRPQTSGAKTSIVKATEEKSIWDSI